MQAKYYRGTYAVCAHCGSRPCSCDDQAAPPAKVTPLVRPASGNAIPFAIWDDLIGRHQLTIVQSGVLLYLCRATIGYGLYSGDLVSVRRIALALRIDPHSTRRALDALQRHGLIERQRRFERNSKERATTHIRVTLPT